ncbi:hypothetical protein B0H13DRAFT_1876483 [Mycena leptocephala]|nr:hypothetical protein B0H13DRAFT_1876483 [Mycena leptocephala]
MGVVNIDVGGGPELVDGDAELLVLTLPPPGPPPLLLALSVALALLLALLLALALTLLGERGRAGRRAGLHTRNKKKRQSAIKKIGKGADGRDQKWEGLEQDRTREREWEWMERRPWICLLVCVCLVQGTNVDIIIEDVDVS